jgi:hypothetical protein
VRVRVRSSRRKKRTETPSEAPQLPPTLDKPTSDLSSSPNPTRRQKHVLG